MLGWVGATYPQHCGASLTPSLLPRASNFLRTSVSLKATRVPKILPRDLHFESGVSQTPQQGIEVLASSSQGRGAVLSQAKWVGLQAPGEENPGGGSQVPSPPLSAPSWMLEHTLNPS